MSTDNFNDRIKKAEKLLKLTVFLLMVATVLLTFLAFDPTLSVFKSTGHELEVTDDEDKIENGIHLRTGLKDGKGLMTVINNCTNCHSAKLVIQNRMSRERWDATILWMQETQNLWDLGSNQKVIVDYLVANYPEPDKNRRENLINISWYELQN